MDQADYDELQRFRARIQGLPGTPDPRIAARRVPEPEIYAETTRGRLQRMPGIDPRLARPPSVPADNPVVPRQTAGFTAGEGPAMGRTGPGVSWQGGAPGQGTTMPPGAQTIDVAARPSGWIGRMAQQVEDLGTAAATKFPTLARIAANPVVQRGLGSVAGGLQALTGGEQLLDSQDSLTTQRGLKNVALGGLTVANPLLGGAANLGVEGGELLTEGAYKLGRHIPLIRRLYDQNNMAGPALKETLAGRTPAEYLAQRGAKPAAAAGGGEPIIIDQEKLLNEIASPEDAKMLRAHIAANPLQQGGIQYQKDGQMYLASLRQPETAARPTGGNGPIARAAARRTQPALDTEDIARAAQANYEGASGPRFVIAGGGQPGFQVVNRDMSATQYPDIRSSENLPEDARAVVRGGGYDPNDTTQVINRVGPQGYGGYIQHYANGGYQVPFAPGSSPVEGEQAYNAKAMVNQRIHDKQAAGVGLNDQDVLDYAMANGIDPQHAEAALSQRYQAEQQAGATVRAHEINAESQRDVEKIRSESAKNAFIKVPQETGGSDPYTGKPYTIDRLYNPQTQQYAPAPSPVSQYRTAADVMGAVKAGSMTEAEFRDALAQLPPAERAKVKR